MSQEIKRLFSLATNPAGMAAIVAALYAGISAGYNAWGAHQHVWTPQIIVAAVGAAVMVYIRQLVTPSADPRASKGEPLLTAAEHARKTQPPGAV